VFKRAAPLFATKSHGIKAGAEGAGVAFSLLGDNDEEEPAPSEASNLRTGTRACDTVRKLLN
jgi:hypothetical protein